MTMRVDIFTYQELMADAGAPVVERIAQVRRRSRIDRKCGACGRPIKAGEYYYRDVVKVDGVLDVGIAHDPDGRCVEYDYDHE